jgi:tetratricopeptide (TPR) repeat protein
MKPTQYLKFEKQDMHTWSFSRPIEWEFFDFKLDKAEAAENEGDKIKATQICLEIIESCPDYLPAFNKLGLLLKEQGDLDGAIQTFESAIEVGLACLPDEFEVGTDLIPWYWEDNRAFLLACEYLGVCYLDKAFYTFEHLSAVNPGYRGISELITKLSNLRGGKDENIE